ncbi:MAG: DNA-processing protein DprA, partial [Planctomycetota bacterium]|nr:DNA-processing protein DprA [Planctomycetota bacterium]
PLLFKIGQGSLESNALRVALVGSRKASVSGLRNAYSLGAQLAERGIVVVSGLARGIDTAALEGALSVRGKTIGVVGHGLHTIYPSENKGLAQKMKERGLILSEHPPGVDPRPHLFPRRNRILSGLCQAVIVVEATKKSGALITARFALEQNREVLAVPGPIDLPQAYGPLDLIRNGAALVRHADDVLDALCLLPSPRSTVLPSQQIVNQDSKIQAQAPFLQAISNQLSTKSLTLNQLARQLETDVSSLSASMVELELAGLVERHGGGFRNVKSI